MSIEVFIRQLEDAWEGHERRFSRRIQNVALAVMEELVFSTPNKTGKTISNYRAELDGFETSVLREAYSPFGGREANGSPTLDQARRTIKAYKVGKSPDIIISNPASWLKKLNAGSSKQAPAGFIQAAILRGRMKAKDST